MRSEKEVYDIVLNFAKTDKRIRMVTLEGSRTNTIFRLMIFRILILLFLLRIWTASQVMING